MQNKRKYVFIAISILGTLFSCTSQITINDSKATQAPNTVSPPSSTIVTPTPIFTQSALPKEAYSISGKVFDNKGKALDGVIVQAFSLDVGVNWSMSSKPTINGIYKITDAPCCTRIELTARKFRFLESKQIIVLKSSASQDLDNFNFGGTGNEEFSLKEDPTQCTVCTNNVTSFCSKNNPSDYQDKSTITGKILDEKNSFLIKDAIVTLKYLNSPDKECVTASVTATDGTYTFKYVPNGGNYEIKVTKTGFVDIIVNVVAKPNLEGDPDKNRHDFYLKE